MASGTAVTLTASVSSGVPVTVGRVTFCDANAKSCADTAIIGSAQLTSAGTAVFKFVPGPGTHSFAARFNGTSTQLPSTSSIQSLTVTASSPTTIQVSASGFTGNYTLYAKVASDRSLLLRGTVRFIDVTSNVVLGSAVLGDVTAKYAFQPAVPYAAGTNPISVAAGDLNGDGYIDVVVANFADNKVGVFLGNGDGTFQPQVSYPTDMGPRGVTLADVNGDGVVDIVVANLYGLNVSVLLGNGDGTFQPDIRSNAGRTPIAIAIGDFNADGKPDVVVANEYNYTTYSYDHTVSILLGNGDGSFQQPVAYNAWTNPFSVAIADFNGDGNQDLLVADAASPGMYVVDCVSVLLGNGDGTFQNSIGLQVVNGPRSAVVGDFNEDGSTDIAAANYESNNVSVILGNGDGSFQSQEPYASVSGPDAMTATDVNGDGALDLVVANYGSNNVSVLLGNGDGSFQSGSKYGVGNSPYAILSGDFTGDGLPDVVTADYGSGTISVLVNSVTSSATAAIPDVTILGTGTHQVQAVYLGDEANASSTSSAIPLTASPLATALNLSVGAETSSYGQPVTISATLVPAVEGTVTTNGQVVTFLDGDATLGTAFLASGTAAISVTTLPAGMHSLSATYNGDGSFLPSSSPSLEFYVSKSAPNLTLITSASALFVDNAITFTTTLSSTATAPTGSVSFYDASALLGTGTLSQGVTHYTTSSLGVGTHVISAAYSGDANFLSQTSPVLQETIQDFEIGVQSGTSSSVRLVGGGTANYHLVLTPSNGTTFPAAVALAVSGLPAGASATFAPANVSSGANTSAITLSIQVPRKASAKRNGTAFLAALLQITGLLALGIAWAPRFRRVQSRVASIMLILTVATVAAFMSACGNSSPGGSQTVPPPTVYTVNVTATSGALSHSTKVTLTLQ